MPVDASIPLAAGNIPGNAMNSMVSMYEFATKMKHQQQAEQAQNALRGIFQDQSNIDPKTGMPNQQAVGKMMQIDPAYGMEIQNTMAKMQHEREQAKTAQIHAKLYQMNINKKQADMLAEAQGEVHAFHDNLMAKGANPQDATARTTAYKNERLDEWVKEGSLLPEQAEAMRGSFNPQERVGLDSRAYKAYVNERKDATKGQVKLTPVAIDQMSKAIDAMAPRVKTSDETGGQGAPYKTAGQTPAASTWSDMIPIGDESSGEPGPAIRIKAGNAQPGTYDAARQEFRDAMARNDAAGMIAAAKKAGAKVQRLGKPYHERAFLGDDGKMHAGAIVYPDLDGGEPVIKYIGGSAKSLDSHGKVESDEAQDAQRRVKQAASAGQPVDHSTIKFMAGQYLAGDKSVLQNLGRGQQGSKNLMELRAEIARQAKEQGETPAMVAQRIAEFEGAKAGQRALGTRTANVEMAVQEAKQMMPLALKASAEMKRTNIRSVNDLQQWALSKTSSPELRRLSAATNSLIIIYARAINPTGVPTDSDKNHAREVLDKGFSDGDYKAAVDQLFLEMGAAEASPALVKQKFRELAGGGEKPPAGKPAPAKPAKDYGKMLGF